MHLERIRFADIWKQKRFRGYIVGDRVPRRGVQRLGKRIEAETFYEFMRQRYALEDDIVFDETHGTRLAYWKIQGE